MFVAICDDDPKAIERYSAMVTRICEKSGLALRLAQFESGTQLLFALADRTNPPDIILLDIGMPKVDGIEVATQLRDRNYKGVIVFVTVKDDRMLDAFDVDAFNYVVKGSPDEEDRFERVFLKAVQRMKDRKRRYLLCNGISEHRNIPLESIRYFSMNRHVCTVHYGKGETFEFISTLGRLLEMLDSCGFVRIQRSYAVNCAHVASYTYRTCTMDDGTQLSVGRNNATKLREMMEEQAHAVVGGGARD